MPQRTVAILLFDEVEVLDFAGPFEIFSVTGGRDGSDPFVVVTVAREKRAISARGRLSVVPHHGFADCPRPDILLVPGGFGTRALLEDREVLDWIGARAREAELLLSVCTGALLLAKAGLLAGREVTTHHGAYDLLEGLAPGTTVHRDRRVVDGGDLVCSAGVAAGMDMSLHVVARLCGAEVARETARYIEYPWRGSAAALAVQD